LVDALCGFPSQLLSFVRTLLDVESRVVFLVVCALTGRLFRLALSLLLAHASRFLSFASAALGFALHLYPNATTCHPWSFLVVAAPASALILVS
jgi:hypothetical protein